MLKNVNNVKLIIRLVIKVKAFILFKTNLIDFKLFIDVTLVLIAFIIVHFVIFIALAIECNDFANLFIA